MSDILIREATPNDLPVLLQFEQGVITAERPFDHRLRDQFNYYDLKPFIEDEDKLLLVAEKDGKLVGSGHAKIKTADPFYTYNKFVFLGFMYVVPELRGQGINQRIIAEFKKWALQRGIRELQLQVYDENISAIKAYEKVGFKKILTTMRMDATE